MKSALAPMSSSATGGAGAFTKSFGDFKQGFTEVGAGALAKFMMALDPSGKKAEPLKNALKPVLDSLMRNTVQLAEDLSESDIEAHRKALKAQDMTHKMKMEASRTANSVQMQNQAAEMEASFNTQLAAKVDQLKSGGSSALREAQEKAQELQNELNQRTKELDRAEEQNKSLRGLLRSKEVEAKESENEAKNLREAVEQVERAALLANKDTEVELQQLRAALEDAAAEVERASIQNESECKRQVVLMSKRLKAELAARQKGSAMDARVKRLHDELGSMSQTLADKEVDMETERAEMREKIAEAEKEAEAARRKLNELFAGAMPGGGGGGDVRAILEARQTEVKRLTEQLEDTHMQLKQTEAEAELRTSELDALRRELAEKMTRVLAEAQRAALQSADECKRQVEAMASRLRNELDRAKKNEREHAQDQLSRLLGEITVLNKQLGQAEAKLRDAEDGSQANGALVQRLKKMEAQERAARDALSQALGDVQHKSSSNLQLNEQLSRLLAMYRQMKGEFAMLKVALDKALREVANTSLGDSVPLADKLTTVLDAYRHQQEEAASVRATLDKALEDVAITVGENANLSDKLRKLLVEYRRMSEDDLKLREALKRQNASLSSAYHRVKQVELELTHANAAGVEQRESLVTAALIGLQQLRGRLGAVHALRQDASKPVEEAIVVKKMQHSSSVPTLGGDLRPPSIQGTARFDAFMHRLADAVGVPVDSQQQSTFPPVSPYWSVSSSRPVPDGPAGGRFRELSPVSMPRVPKPGGRAVSSHGLGGLDSSRSSFATTPKGPTRSLLGLASPS